MQSDLLKALLLAQVGATLAMVGVIWFVQLVHYPLFSGVGADGFVRYAAEHGVRTSWVVVPPMLIEAATTAALLIWQPPGVTPTLAWIGAILLLIIWASTFLVQVPQHTILRSGFNPSAYYMLVRSNWIRTIAWSARGGLVVWYLARALG